jgi:monomeric sarcosine oxidase
MNAKKAVQQYDLIVIGGGVLGLAAAWQCGKKFERVLVLEQFPFFNQRGSSADFCRMWRVMYSEAYLAELAMQTSPMWDELSKALGTELIDKTGLLNFGVDTPYTPEGSLQAAKQVMDQLKIPYTQLTCQELQSEYPFRNLPKEYYGLYQANGGTFNVPAVLKGFYQLADDEGVVLQENEQVVEIESGPTGVQITTNIGNQYDAAKVIVCGGAYVNQILQPLGIRINLQVWEMTYAYYQMENPSAKYPMWFQFDFPPVAGGSRLFYGFPSEPWARPGYVRIAVDFASRVMASPDRRTFVPSVEDIHLTMDYIQEHLTGVDATPTQMATCLVPLVPDNGYVLDFAPDSVPHHKNILVCTAGWAFKFAPMFGLILAQLAATGSTSYHIAPMSITRPGVLVGAAARGGKKPGSARASLLA